MPRSKGQKHTPASKEAIKKALAERTEEQKAEHRRKLSEAAKRRRLEEDTKAQIGKSVSGTAQRKKAEKEGQDGKK